MSKPCICGHIKGDHGKNHSTYDKRKNVPTVCWVPLHIEPEGCMCIEYREAKRD